MALVDGRWTGPIWDSHLHLDRAGRFLDAAMDFRRTGGTGLCLVHKPAFGFGEDGTARLPKDRAGYADAYADTLDMAETVRRGCDLDVRVILGPHPVVWEKQIHTLGMDAATSLHMEAVELAISHCEDGAAVGIGEVGRPHYPVASEIREAADEMLLEIMRMAAAADVPIQLHVEDDGAATNAALAALCDRAGLPRHRAVHHYAPADLSPAFTHGLSQSVSMGRDSIREIVRTHAGSPDGHAPGGPGDTSGEEAGIGDITPSLEGGTWTMETDYMDDPRRPGAVLGPKTLPKRTQQLLTALLEGGMDAGAVEDLMWNVHRVWPSTLYGES